MIYGESLPLSGESLSLSANPPHLSGESRPISGESRPFSGKSRPLSGNPPHLSGDPPSLSGDPPPISSVDVNLPKNVPEFDFDLDANWDDFPLPEYNLDEDFDILGIFDGLGWGDMANAVGVVNHSSADVANDCVTGSIDDGGGLRDVVAIPEPLVTEHPVRDDGVFVDDRERPEEADVVAILESRNDGVFVGPEDAVNEWRTWQDYDQNILEIRYHELLPLYELPEVYNRIAFELDRAVAQVTYHGTLYISSIGAHETVAEDHGPHISEDHGASFHDLGFGEASSGGGLRDDGVFVGPEGAGHIGEVEGGDPPAGGDDEFIGGEDWPPWLHDDQHRMVIRYHYHLLRCDDLAEVYAHIASEMGRPVAQVTHHVTLYRASISALCEFLQGGDPFMGGRGGRGIVIAHAVLVGGRGRADGRGHEAGVHGMPWSDEEVLRLRLFVEQHIMRYATTTRVPWRLVAGNLAPRTVNQCKWKYQNMKKDGKWDE